MLLTIAHRTTYRYDAPPPYGVMRLRVCPRSLGPQRVLDWQIDIEGAERQVSYRDHMGNEVWLISTTGAFDRIDVTARGRVETRETHGVFGPHRSLAPLWLFTRQTRLTAPGDGVARLIQGMADETGGPPADRGTWAGGLPLAHLLMERVAQAVAYDTDDTHPATTAEEALARGTGVCQDHSHIIIAAARQLGIPARYVSGYLRLDDREDQTATHAWAELHLDGLGWVGFDASNRISPDERYVRIASGLDYDDAAPMGGVRYGSAAESLDVHLSIGEQ